MPPPIRIHPFRPRLLDVLPGYDCGQFFKDDTGPSSRCCAPGWPTT